MYHALGTRGALERSAMRCGQRWHGTRYIGMGVADRRVCALPRAAHARAVRQGRPPGLERGRGGGGIMHMLLCRGAPHSHLKNLLKQLSPTLPISPQTLQKLSTLPPCAKIFPPKSPKSPNPPNPPWTPGPKKIPKNTCYIKKIIYTSTVAQPPALPLATSQRKTLEPAGDA